MNKENLKSVPNQRFADQHRDSVSIEELRAERRVRLKGVVIYRRDSIPEHSKLLIEERIDCA